MKLSVSTAVAALVAFIPEKEAKQVKALYQMREDIEMSDAGMERIAGLLRHNPSEWLYLYKDHPLRERAESGLKEIISDLDEHAVILVHPHERWCLVAQGEIIYPAIFKSSIVGTHLFKIVGGKGSRWLLTMRKDVANILDTQKYTDGDTSPQLTRMQTDVIARLTGAGFKV